MDTGQKIEAKRWADRLTQSRDRPELAAAGRAIQLLLAEIDELQGELRAQRAREARAVTAAPRRGGREREARRPALRAPSSGAAAGSHARTATAPARQLEPPPRVRGEPRRPGPPPPFAALLPVVAAVGGAPRMNLRERTVRVTLLAVAAIALLIALIGRIAFAAPASDRAPTVLNAAWVVPGALMRGGQPQDIDFVNMRDLFGIGGVVNFRPATRIERHVVQGFQLDYLWLQLPPRGAPTDRQLRRLARFVKVHAANGRAVFIHDYSGLEQSPTVAVMLEMLHGTPAAEAARQAREATPVARPLFTRSQIAAIDALARALHQSPLRPSAQTPVPGAARYADALELRW